MRTVRAGDARAQKNSEGDRSGEKLSSHKVDYGTLFSFSVARGKKEDKRELSTGLRAKKYPTSVGEGERQRRGTERSAIGFWRETSHRWT